MPGDNRNKKYNKYIARLQENNLHGQAPGLCPLKMDKPGYFSDKPEKNPFYKISSYQGFTIKQIVIV